MMARLQSLIAIWCGVGSFALLIVSCSGEGGGGSSGTSASGSVPITLSGTAATGAAIASTNTVFKCANGSSGLAMATAMTNGTGEYTVTLAAPAALPCMIEIQIAGSTLHGLATVADANGRVIANITPLTEAVLATALGQTDLLTYFTNLTAAQFNTLKTLDIATAWMVVKVKIAAQRVDASAITGDPLAQVFVADGTGYDRILDDLKRAATTAAQLYAVSSPVTATGMLNDTGIYWCRDANSNNNATCSALDWSSNLWGLQQDAYFGRDTQARAGTLVKIGSGMAGFDFTRMASSGQALAIQNGFWDDQGTETAGTKWDCVRDNVTGLMWEVKRNELVGSVKHLRHKDHLYSWYNPVASINGGVAGYETPVLTRSDALITSPTCTGVADINKCNTQSYANAVNVTGICGFKDWRMPTIDELSSIVHLGRSQNAAIDTNHFPNSPSKQDSALGWTWSSSPFAGRSDGAWLIYFSNGDDDDGGKYYAGRIRLVRSGQ